MMLRVLCILAAYRPRAFCGSFGGGEISNRILLEGLVRKGHQVVVFTLNGGGYGEFVENGVRVIEIRTEIGIASPLVSRLAFRARLLGKLQTGFSADIVLTATEALGAALVVRDYLSAPLVLFVRAFENFERPEGLFNRAKQGFKRATLGDFGPDAVARADLLLPNSEFMARYCRERLRGAVDTAVVYPPIDYAMQQTRSGQSIRTITMVGTSAKKGTELVCRLANIFPELNFRILGYPGLGAGDCKRSSNLELVGWCDVQKEFSEKADLVLVPSVWPEPFGRVALEAVAAGKVVLVSDIGGLPEAVGYEKTLMVEPDDFPAWRERLEAVLANPAPFIEVIDKLRPSLSLFEAGLQVDHLEQALLELVKDRADVVKGRS